MKVILRQNMLAGEGKEVHTIEAGTILVVEKTEWLNEKVLKHHLDKRNLVEVVEEESAVKEKPKVRKQFK